MVKRQPIYTRNVGESSVTWRIFHMQQRKVQQMLLIFLVLFFIAWFKLDIINLRIKDKSKVI